MARPQTFVIAGASLAGAKAAETLRSEGFAGHRRASPAVEYDSFPALWLRLRMQTLPLRR